MRKHGVLAVTIAFAFTIGACSSSSEVATTVPDPADVAEVDLAPEVEALISELDRLVTMMPGTGRGARAEALANEVGFFEVIPGTADHLASVVTPEGPMHLLAYQAHEPDIDGGVAFCVGEMGPTGGGAGCSSEPTTEPEAGSGSSTDDHGGRNSITAFGGDDAPFAILTTEDGARIGVVTVRGWAYADWPASWGLPDRIMFYDSEGNEGFSAGYDWF